MRETTKDLLRMALGLLIAILATWEWARWVDLFLAGFWFCCFVYDAEDDPVWVARWDRIRRR